MDEQLTVAIPRFALHASRLTTTFFVSKSQQLFTDRTKHASMVMLSWL